MIFHRYKFPLVVNEMFVREDWPFRANFEECIEQFYKCNTILANRPGICRIVPENEVPSCSPGNNAKCPAI